MRRTTCAVLTGVLIGGTTVGCGSDDPDAKLELGSKSVTISPSADGSSEPPEDSETVSGAGKIKTSYPQVGLELTSLPDVTGEKLRALKAYVTYEVGLRQLARTGKLNRRLVKVSAPQELASMRYTAQQLQTKNRRYRGEVAIDVDFEQYADRTAVFALCTDATDLRLVDKGQVKPIEGKPVTAGTVFLTNTGRVWQVSEYESLEKPC